MAYKEKEEVQDVVRCLTFLHFLPAGDIPQGFADIKTIFYRLVDRFVLSRQL